jgi:hypothetical protein
MIPLVAKILEVMDERGLIDLPLRVNGLEVRVVPEAPLAQAQAMEEVQAIMQYAQIMQGFGADGAVALKTEVLPDYLAEKLSVPAAVRNTREERAVLLEEAQKAQQNQIMAQSMMMQAQADAASGMAPEGMPA